MHVYTCVCKCMQHVCGYLQRPDEDTGYLRTRVTSGAAQHGCWETKPGPLEEQCTLLARPMAKRSHFPIPLILWWWELAVNHCRCKCNTLRILAHLAVVMTTGNVYCTRAVHQRATDRVKPRIHCCLRVKQRIHCCLRVKPQIHCCLRVKPQIHCSVRTVYWSQDCWRAYCPYT